MTLSTIEIHEFSTGIKPQKTADGWVSLGFIGQYMNVTIDVIPHIIERSIANREFAVAEGAASDQRAAVIGRVLGTGEETYSVLAIVTRGRDEKGRSASMYRYFFTQGSDGVQNLRYILAWWEERQLKFDPFDIKEIGKPHEYHINHENLQKQNLIDDKTDEQVILPPANKFDLININALASKKYNKNKNGLGISWAYNVEALEKPERFLVIQAASEKAYQILQQAINRTPQVLAPVQLDEEAIKSAIRGLMNSSQVKPANVKVIADALQNEEITSKYWHTLFNGQGAKQAIDQRIYSPQMVRLITLRAVVIPDTMLEFLKWLNIKPGQKSNDTQQVSLEFQKAIRAGLPKDKLANSIKFLLPELLKKSSSITPEAVCWLLKSNDSVWASSYQEFVNDVIYDLQLIVNSLKTNVDLSSSYKCDPQVWATFNKYKNLIYSTHANHNLEEYTPFAKLFEQLGNYELAAYFYQVSQGLVPKKIFLRLPNSYNTFTLHWIGLELQREVTILELIIYYLFYWRYIVPIQFVVILSICLSILSFSGGVLVGKFKPGNNGGSQSNNTATTPPANNNETPNRTDDLELGIPQDKLKTALADFDSKTKVALEAIVGKNKDDKDPKVQKLKEVLKVNDFKYQEAIKGGNNNEETQKLINAIYKYQQLQFPGQQNENKWDGIIEQNKDTFKKLEADVN
ncbi:MAG: hypothetical protein EAZ87_10775 [Nostocales cyanobacterium]|nr:MAG: hypothetical protein EAZ87_10775 [Nostocales cyanobacterium]